MKPARKPGRGGEVRVARIAPLPGAGAPLAELVNAVPAS